MAFKIKYNNDNLRKKITKYAGLVGKDTSQVVQNAGRICALECMVRTQPFGKNKVAQETGKGAITKDLRHIFTWVTPSSWKLLKAFKRKKKPATKLTNEKGDVWATASMEQITSKQTAKAFHSKSRKANTGRTYMKKMTDKALVKSSVYKAFRKELWQKVGLSKAGWAKAALECKADVKAPMRGVPSWVQNNISKSSGSASTSKAGKGLSFEMSITNSLPWASRVFDAADQTKAVQIAKEKMISFLNAAIRAHRAIGNA